VTTYTTQPCRKCGATRFRHVSAPMFRVEACVQCGTHRATTAPPLGATTVHILLAHWGNGGKEIIGVFASREAAETEASRLKRSQGIRAADYIVHEFVVK
jgi:hypothetical protein